MINLIEKEGGFSLVQIGAWYLVTSSELIGSSYIPVTWGSSKYEFEMRDLYNTLVEARNESEG